MQDPIDRYHAINLDAEFIASCAIGVQNVYFTGGNKGGYITKTKLNDNYLVESERYEIEKDLIEQEESLESDLKEESSNYITRLYLDSMAESVELDLNSTNIVQKYNLWNGKTKTKVAVEFNNKNFSLYDVYVKITCQNDFTRKDLLALRNLKFHLTIGGTTIYYRDFFSILLLELINDQDVLIEPNIIYLKIFTFENMLYGIPNKFLKYHEVHIEFFGLNIMECNPEKYSIDAFYSGKDIYLPDIKSEHLKGMCLEQVIIQTQETGTELMYFGKNKWINAAINHPTQMLMFFPFDPNSFEKDEIDELEEVEIDSIGLFLNGHPIWFEKEDLIHIHFMGLDLCILCLDEQFRDIDKFKKYFKNDLDLNTMKSINFSRLDNVKFIFECGPDKNYGTDKPFHLFYTGLNINVLRIMSGLAGLAYCP